MSNQRLEDIIICPDCGCILEFDFPLNSVDIVGLVCLKCGFKFRFGVDCGFLWHCPMKKVGVLC